MTGQACANAAICLAIAEDQRATLKTRTQAYIRAATYIGGIQAAINDAEQSGQIKGQWPADTVAALHER